MTTEVVIHCAERQCIGQHDDDGDCILPECDWRCIGHFGQPTDCVLCPNERCYDHTNGTCELCEEPYCGGHFTEKDEKGYPGMFCEYGHANWCEGDTEGTLCNPGKSCELDLGMGIWLSTEIVDATTSITFQDWKEDEETWGTIDTVEKADEFEVIFARARALLKAELEYTSRFREDDDDEDDEG